MSVMIEEAQRTTFAAMGNTVHVVAVGGTDDHLTFAQQRIAELESMWSRFIPTSDVSRLNCADGKPTEVEPETITLLQFMADAYRITSGLFDPTQLPHLIETGYGRSLTSERLTILPTGVTWSHGLNDMVIDVGNRCVTLPPGVTIDAGGIGKGLTADIVATGLMDIGVNGARVNVGGDLRCAGAGDRDGSWEIGIAGTDGTGEIGRVKLRDGAVATSSVLAKTFTHDGEHRSHLIDPRSHRALAPRTSRVTQATVIAAECVWAEVLTKTLILEEPAQGFALFDSLDLAAMIVTDDSQTHRSSTWAEYQA
jgi:thiamine biosynthesis lipoprotein